jgi:hypothetical protein
VDVGERPVARGDAVAHVAVDPVAGLHGDEGVLCGEVVGELQALDQWQGGLGVLQGGLEPVAHVPEGVLVGYAAEAAELGVAGVYLAPAHQVLNLVAALLDVQGDADGVGHVPGQLQGRVVARTHQVG